MIRHALRRGRWRYHGNHWAGTEEVSQSVEEGATLEIVIVLLGEILRGVHQLDGHQLVTLLLESCNDVGDLRERALDNAK